MGCKRGIIRTTEFAPKHKGFGTNGSPPPFSRSSCVPRPSTRRHVKIGVRAFGEALSIIPRTLCNTIGRPRGPAGDPSNAWMAPEGTPMGIETLFPCDPGKCPFFHNGGVLIEMSRTEKNVASHQRNPIRSWPHHHPPPRARAACLTTRRTC